MAENKKSFILYTDQKELIEELTNEEAGILLKHLYRYVNDENPVCEDKQAKLAFISIKQALKRDLKKWETQQKQRKEAARKSVESRQRKQTTVNDRSSSSTVNDNVNVSVNVNDNNKSSKDDQKDNFELFWNQFHKITGKPKEKKEAAFKHWKKLKLDEQRKAYAQIEKFSKSKNDKQYLVIARTYLSDKVFNDEFIVSSETKNEEVKWQ